jgi:hypothetical protein
MTRTDTEPQLTTLAERAVAAFEAARLEAGATAEQRAQAERDRMVAAAAKSITDAFGSTWVPESLGLTTDNGHEYVVADVAGVQLAYDPRYPGLRGLLACPLCRLPDRRTVVRVNNLERLGQLLVAPATFELDAHVVPDGLDDCDGLTRTPRVEAQAQWQARYATTADTVQDRLNDLEADGYDSGAPIIVGGLGGGWLVVGHARTPRDPDDPF